MPGRFITFEGVDGAGKSTQLARLAARLRAGGEAVLTTREPGGTPLAEAIRGLLLPAGAPAPAPLAELALMFAARADHLQKVILPALARGETVLCDRFTDSSEAYQGVARGLGAELVWDLHRGLCGGLMPDLTLILDLDPAAALGRARERNAGAADTRREARFEEEGLALQRKVRAAFRALAARRPERCVLIPADDAPDAVAAAIAAVVAARTRLGLG